ncbi:tyrosine-type recombinase/integrase [Spongiactinospora sp. TRM90649]|uniref:tyrosine-type recombinase/integrase n=1 Tax=Spongiactinospora sp. TRM90649 TaxID=3031114 RepID=UPI0023F643F2|nr:tyrosine-type recombinase/integrase [Spongiactinospora sp. TRM90649]MDF5759130.1 tyrosine-type recombinase/integrase [Spongiactinospora sp. TRM90649]
MAKAMGQASRAPQLLDLVSSWELRLRADGKAGGTVRSYLDSVRALSHYLAAQRMPVEIEGVGAEHVGAFLAASTAATSAGNAHKHFRNLRVFFNWLVADGERAAGSPMAGMEGPAVAPAPARALCGEEMTALLAVCSGDTFECRRDTAIVRILMDNGMRLSWLAGLRYSGADAEANDVWPAARRLRVTLGDHALAAPIGDQAAAAVDRYLRARARHPHAISPWLWLPMRGATAAGGDRRLTPTGIQQMLERRGREAGVRGRLHPHRFRETVTGEYLRAGGDPRELMRIVGWRSMEMARRQARAAERASAYPDG